MAMLYCNVYKALITGHYNTFYSNSTTSKSSEFLCVEQYNVDQSRGRVRDKETDFR